MHFHSRHDRHTLFEYLFVKAPFSFCVSVCLLVNKVAFFPVYFSLPTRPQLNEFLYGYVLQNFTEWKPRQDVGSKSFVCRKEFA